MQKKLGRQIRLGDVVLWWGSKFLVLNLDTPSRRAVVAYNCWGEPMTIILDNVYEVW